MVKELTILKQKFYKCEGKESGSQQQCIENCTQDNIVICCVTKRYGRCWATVTPSKYLELLQKDYSFHEVIHAYPHKVYFDVDYNPDHVYTPEEQSDFHQHIMQLIDEIFPNNDSAISGSFTDDKLSLHIVLNNYLVKNQEQKDNLLSIVKHLKTQHESFDTLVYSKNKQFKSINQSKMNDSRVQNIITNPNQQKHLITAYFNTNTVEFPIISSLSEPIQQQIYIDDSHKKFQVTMLPKQSLTLWRALSPGRGSLGVY